MISEVLAMAARGWHLFPVGVASKRPLVKWGTEATSGPDKLREWFDRPSPPNIGISCGPSGLVVIDVDRGAGGFESLRDLPELPPTITVRTGGGGIHLYLRADPEIEIRNSASRLPGVEGWLDAPGVDCRARGGYVVAPPSIHSSGLRYRWIRTSEDGPAPIPGWLRPVVIGPARSSDRASLSGPGSEIGSSSRYVAAAVRSEIGELRSAGKGARNDALVRSAFNLGSLIGPDGITRSDAETLLEAAGIEIGLGEIETRKTVRSGLDAGSRNPRRLS